MSKVASATRYVPVASILRNFRPGSYDPPWTWDDEERDILGRECLCCGEPGHYQQALEEHLAAVGEVRQPVCLGPDGRVWDGHHRIVAARRLGFEYLPVEHGTADDEAGANQDRTFSGASDG